MPSPQPPSRFCGIDIGKNTHVACILGSDGQPIAKSHSFANNAAGYQQILSRLGDAGGPAAVHVAMEATGHYWYGLHEFLMRHAYPVAVLNPIQTAQQAKKGIRKTQTDKIDARHIATLLRNGEHRPAVVPGDFAMTCRQLTRLRYAMIRQSARIKQRLWSRLHPVWPEYEACFTDPFCNTGRRLLAAAPTPADVLAMQPAALSDLIRKASRGKFGAVKVEEIRRAAADSVGIHRGLDGARIGIRSLLSQLDALRPLRKALESQIVPLAERLPAYLLTLPGADALRVVSLFGETDPIETFRRPEQLVAFAGLDLVVSQSGEYQAPRRHISKRGSPFLRRTLWAMAHQACYREGELRTYWLRKRKAGLHHLAAVTATAIKLCRMAWRIMTDRRDYQPQPPACKS